MALKIPDPSERFILDQLRTGWGSGLTIKLFQNNYVPNDATVLANLTIANFSGYTDFAIGPWSGPITVGSRAFVQAPPKTWTVAAGGVSNLIYGYWVIDQFGNLLWLERDPAAPTNMSTIGDTYTITPTFTFVSEF